MSPVKGSSSSKTRKIAPENDSAHTNSELGSRRSGSMAPPRAGRGTDCPRRAAQSSLAYRARDRSRRPRRLLARFTRALSPSTEKGVCPAAKRRAVGSRETGKKGTRRRVSIAPPTAGPGTECLRRATHYSARDRSRRPGRLCGPVHESPTRASRARLSQLLR
jgi:hypothetical protein